MKSIATSSNHSCSIAANDKVYIWGHNNEINRLGLANQDSSEIALEQPEVLTFLDMGIQKQKEEIQAQEERNLITSSIKAKDKNKKDQAQSQETHRSIPLSKQTNRPTSKEPSSKAPTGSKNRPALKPVTEREEHEHSDDTLDEVLNPK